MKFCYAHRATEDEKTLHQNVWNYSESTDVLAYKASSNEVLANRSISFSQMVCRFVGELNMNITAGSTVKAKYCHSICEPDWGNRMSIGFIEEANCCIEYNEQLGFVVRMIRDIEADENFVLYDEVCEAMYIDEHVESKKGWLAGEKTMTDMDNATFIDLEELANKEKFMDLHMVLERPRYLTRGLELTLSIYNQ